MADTDPDAEETESNYRAPTQRDVPDGPPVRAAPATLETLPAELRVQILFYLVDLNDLRAVALASPVLHQQYRLDRQRLLSQALRLTLRNVLVEAYTHQASSALSYRLRKMPQRTLQQAVTQVIDDYVELRCLSINNVVDHCSIDELAAMASFYGTIIQPLLLECAARFQQNLENPSTELGTCWSTTERIRPLRALYRFEIFQDLFGYHDPESRFDSPKVLAMFFGIFHPWEVEEINCIDHLIRARYDRVFDDIKWDVHKTNPRFGVRTTPMTPKGAFDLDSQYNRLSLLNGTIARGLALFHAVSRIGEETADDHEALVRLMQENMTWSIGHPISEQLRYSTQDMRRFYHPSEGDRAEAARERMPFLGDGEDGPPLAWVIIWRGTYSNTYGGVIPSSLRGWGYVFWDARRLAGRGGEMKRELRRAWENEWHGEDPRD
ncbi:hypothetical protein C8A01DRAFT_49262 [Parachaetomium inaequale]|uniref:F-box domain-containing protein n=1 Tax=Parachaetomium inaequale TaxID=2588326 RepID=A0AAN6P9R1_9PEZI|nr:hypothetical protein C8A01DRAFT_49262 [Parachaetomium inaequale]